ncbi:MAG: hypothetical protein J6S92_01725 [Oscillospiraceae bacterium]|nr:hypothetical protein [Oscillospiraceae bacterium]
MPAKKPPQGMMPPPGMTPPPPGMMPPPPGMMPPPPAPRRKKKQSPTTKLKRKIASVTGIPTTASGRKKKAERVVANFLIDKLDQLKKK